MKLSNLFARKMDEEEEDLANPLAEAGEEAPEADAGASDEPEAAGEIAAGDEADGADGADEADEDEAPPGRSLVFIGVLAAVSLLVVGGAAWFFFASDEAPGKGTAEAPAGGYRGPRVLLDLPPGPERSSASSRSETLAGQSADAVTAAGSLNALATGPATPGAGVMVPSVTLASYAKIPDVPGGPPLSPVPDPDLVEQTAEGPLPKIAEDGREPWQVYARPFDANDRRARIAVIVTEMGLSRAATMAAISKLPPAVTLAFVPYARGLDDWAIRARGKGHEILLSLPLEPVNFPVYDPGPYGLLTTLEPKENIKRLNTVLARLPGYVGVATTMGSKFSTLPRYLRPVLEALKARGLMLVDLGASADSLVPAVAAKMGLPWAMGDSVVDQDLSPAQIRARLADLEKRARRTAVAVAVASPSPATLASLAAWTASFKEKDLVLAPVSALANRQAVP